VGGKGGGGVQKSPGVNVGSHEDDNQGEGGTCFPHERLQGGRRPRQGKDGNVTFSLDTILQLPIFFDFLCFFLISEYSLLSGGGRSRS
jgi:hypothetical protein